MPIPRRLDTFAECVLGMRGEYIYVVYNRHRIDMLDIDAEILAFSIIDLLTPSAEKHPSERKVANMDWINQIGSWLGLVAAPVTAVLGVLHAKNAAKIAGMFTTAAAVAPQIDQVAQDAQNLAHGQWTQALPDMIAEAMSIMSTVQQGQIGVLSTPGGSLVVQNNGKTLVPLDLSGSRQNPLASQGNSYPPNVSQASQGASPSASTVAGLRQVPSRRTA